MLNYEWDNHKAKINYQKHKIYFADAVTVFKDNFALTMADEHPDEERLIIMGIDCFGRILVVVYTWRGDDVIRLISARKATKFERQQYDEEI